MTSSEITWEIQPYHGQNGVCGGTDKLTRGDFCIYLDPRVCRDPGLGKLNSLMYGDSVAWSATAVDGVVELTPDRR